MRFKFTLLLLFANIVTFAFIWNAAGGNAETEISAQSLFAADISEVSVRDGADACSFSVERRGRDWFLEKPFPWRADAFAVNRLLNELRFLDNSLGFSVEEVLDAGNTLSSYGLEKPVAVVTVNDSSGTHSLRIGKTTPDGRSVYVLSPDGKFIIPAPMSLFNAISQTPDELRVREVFSMRPYEVRAITVRTVFSVGSEQRVGLVRSRKGDDDPVAAGEGRENSSWRFETPVAAAADSQLVEKRLGDLTSLAYVRIVSGNAAPDDASGLKSPSLRFTLDAANRSRTLLVGNPDPTDASGKTLFAKLEDNPAIFTVPAETVNSWKTASRELRDPYFFNFNPANLTAISIHDEKNALVLHRLNFSRAEASADSEKTENASSVAAEPFLGALASPRSDIFSAQSGADADPLYNAWQMPVAPGSSVTSVTQAEPKIVAELIGQLRNLRATRSSGADNPEFSAAQRRLCEAFVADVATPEDIVQMKFNTPLRIVELEFAQPASERTKTVTLTIAPAAEDDTPMHAKTGTAIYSITPEILPVLSVHPSYFRNRTVYTLPAGGKIVSIRLFELDGFRETAILDEKCPTGAENWEETLEKNPEPFPQALAKLLHSVSTVTAESYLPEPFSRNFADTQYLDMGVPEKWRYKIEIGVRLSDGEKNTPGKTETLTYYLTRRLGGTTQLAGSPAQNCIFRIRQDFIDAMHTLTFNRSGIIPAIGEPSGVPAEADNIIPAQSL